MELKINRVLVSMPAGTTAYGVGDSLNGATISTINAIDGLIYILVKEPTASGIILPDTPEKLVKMVNMLHTIYLDVEPISEEELTVSVQ